MNFDSIQNQELKDMIEEFDLNSFLKFKQTSNDLIIKNDVAI